jgi:hypothetical protein
MRTALTLVSLAAGLSYIGLMATALIASHSDVPLRKLSRVVDLYGWAIAAQCVVLAVNIATVDVVWIAVSAATLGATILARRLTRQRRDLKAERVQLDAERTVRDWGGDLR